MKRPTITFHMPNSIAPEAVVQTKCRKSVGQCRINVVTNNTELYSHYVESNKYYVKLCCHLHAVN
jgi:hypothetical protein